MRIISAQLGPLAAPSANSIVTTAAGVANTPFTLTTSPYVLDNPRRIIITSTQTETGRTFAVVGTDWNGQQQSETISGVTATAVQSIYDYATIISITPNSATAGNITVGTNSTASTRPIFLDEWAFREATVQCNNNGTITTTLQQTLDDPTSVYNPTPYTSVTWFSSTDTATTLSTASYMSYFDHAPKMVRLLSTTYSAVTGSATLRISQHASVPL
jgi:hypothetical protein